MHLKERIFLERLASFHKVPHILNEIKRCWLHIEFDGKNSDVKDRYETEMPKQCSIYIASSIIIKKRGGKGRRKISNQKIIIVVNKS